MLNCVGHIVIVVVQEWNHDGNRGSALGVDGSTWFVAATTLPVRRIQNDPGVVPATGYVDISTQSDSLADCSIFRLPRQIPGNPRESWGLLRIPYAELSIFLVSHVGTEIALRELGGHSLIQSFRLSAGRYIFNYERLR